MSLSRRCVVRRSSAGSYAFLKVAVFPKSDALGVIALRPPIHTVRRRYLRATAFRLRKFPAIFSWTAGSFSSLLGRRLWGSGSRLGKASPRIPRAPSGMHRTLRLPFPKLPVPHLRLPTNALPLTSGAERSHPSSSSEIASPAGTPTTSSRLLHISLRVPVEACRRQRIAPWRTTVSAQRSDDLREMRLTRRTKHRQPAGTDLRPRHVGREL